MAFLGSAEELGNKQKKNPVSWEGYGAVHAVLYLRFLLDSTKKEKLLTGVFSSFLCIFPF